MGWGWRNKTRADKGQAEIVLDLRRIGASVEVIGHPLDLLVGLHGVTLLVEVKRPPGPKGGRSGSGQHLRDTQKRFIESWRGSTPLVVTELDAVEQVVAAVERLRRD